MSGLRRYNIEVFQLPPNLRYNGMDWEAVCGAHHAVGENASLAAARLMDYLERMAGHERDRHSAPNPKIR